MGRDDTWSATANARRDWDIARAIISDVLPKDGRLLDVGCFDGGFLEPLVDLYNCNGIEINPGAREKAAERGVVIRGEDVGQLEGMYDCITSFDVIEHVESPVSLITKILACVPRGGRVLISSGNLDSFTFRLMGSRYWYCGVAEHISFVSPRWFQNASTKLGFEVERVVCFSHGNASFFWALKEVSANILYRFAPVVLRLLRRKGVVGIDPVRFRDQLDCPPGWASAKDHFLVLLRRL
jgi:SAM-dependent methyltransferase